MLRFLTVPRPRRQARDLRLALNPNLILEIGSKTLIERKQNKKTLDLVHPQLSLN
jgi:transcriptional regulator of met regulon